MDNRATHWCRIRVASTKLVVSSGTALGDAGWPAPANRPFHEQSMVYVFPIFACRLHRVHQSQVLPRCAMFSLRSVRRLSVSVARCAAPAARAPLLSVAARAVSATTPWAAQPSVRRYSATPAALQEATVVNDDGLVIEVNQDNFAATVMKSSTPVILDCYAECVPMLRGGSIAHFSSLVRSACWYGGHCSWCNPCKQLGPMLEAAVRLLGGTCVCARGVWGVTTVAARQVRKAGGKVIMAKLNTDENPELAQGLRVQRWVAQFRPPPTHHHQVHI